MIRLAFYQLSSKFSEQHGILKKDFIFHIAANLCIDDTLLECDPEVVGRLVRIGSCVRLPLV